MAKGKRTYMSCLSTESGIIEVTLLMYKEKTSQLEKSSNFESTTETSKTRDFQT